MSFKYEIIKTQIAPFQQWLQLMLARKVILEHLSETIVMPATIVEYDDEDSGDDENASSVCITRRETK